MLRLVVAPTKLDIDILVERPGEPVAGSWQNAPTTAGVSRIADHGVVRGVAQAEQGEGFQRTVERNETHRSASAHGEIHPENLRRQRRRRMTCPVTALADAEDRKATTE